MPAVATTAGRSCLSCKDLRMEFFYDGSWAVECGRVYWYLSNGDASDEFKEAIATAEICGDYTEAKR